MACLVVRRFKQPHVALLLPFMPWLSYRCEITTFFIAIIFMPYMSVDEADLTSWRVPEISRDLPVRERHPKVVQQNSVLFSNPTEE